MRFRWAQARRFPVTFLRFHSLSEDFEESCLIGDLNHLNKTSWRWADTTQEVPGDEECAARIYFPFFMAVSQSITTTLSFSFSCSALAAWNQSQEKQDPATERVNCSRLTFSNELIVFTTLVRWNKHIWVAGCHVWGLVFKSVSECMRVSLQISPGD